MTRVVNKRREPYDVYIGRGSKWGNPYTHLDYGKGKWRVDTREDSIILYELYVRRTPQLMAALPELKDKVLGCYCKPLDCHGDVLVRLVEEAT